MSHGIVTPLPRIVAPADATIGGVAVPAGVSSFALPPNTVPYRVSKTVVGVGATFIHYNP